jgi:hypothetical protein
MACGAVQPKGACGRKVTWIARYEKLRMPLLLKKDWLFRNAFSAFEFGVSHV